jgi:meso-butanediol dehydrogenase/(S,S)-butanediol dehydrogenase/diacetyl reductase
VSAAVAKVVETWGTVDVLVNNAGHGDPICVSDMKPAEWNHLLTLNLGSIFVVSKAVWPIFAEKKRGAIINASSITGSMAMFGLAAYGPSKAGVATTTRVMAIEGGKDRTRVDCISPGYILTPGFQEWSKSARMVV